MSSQEFEYNVIFTVTLDNHREVQGLMCMYSNKDLKKSDEGLVGMINYATTALQDQFPNMKQSVLVVREFLE